MKKYGTEEDIPKIKAGFIKTMREEYNTPESKSEELITSFLRIIEDASAYGFSLNHSQAYSYMGYATAWLKYYYPLEFATGFMQAKQDDQDDVIAMTKWAKSKGISVELPKYGVAKSNFSMDKPTNTIFKGVGSIKSINKDLGDKLFEFANDNKGLPFPDMIIKMIEDSVSGKSNLYILASLGFFRDYGSNAKTKRFIEEVFEGKGFKYDRKHADKTKIKRVEALRELWETLEVDDFTVLEQIKNEMEYLGYGETSYDHMPDNLYVVKRAEDRSWCVVLQCYNIKSGINSTMYLALRNRVGVKNLKDYGILRVTETRIDKSDRSWIDSFTLLQ